MSLDLASGVGVHHYTLFLAASGTATYSQDGVSGGGERVARSAEQRADLSIDPDRRAVEVRLRTPAQDIAGLA